MKRLNTQPSPSPRPYKNLRGKQIHVSGLNTAYKQFFNTPEDTFQDKWTLIQLIWTNMSTINDVNTKAKIPMKNTWGVVQPNMSPLISISGTQWKQFLLCMNMTNLWCISHMYFSTCFPPLCIASKIVLSTIR